MEKIKWLYTRIVVLMAFIIGIPFSVIAYASSSGTGNENATTLNATYMGENSNVNTIAATTAGALPCIGSPKILVFYTDFKNGSQNWTKTKEEVEQMFFSEAGKTDSSLAYTSSDSLRSYYYRSSYGKVDIEGDVYEYQTQQDTSYYTSFNMVLDEIIEYYRNEIDWNQYDSNNDGYVDGIYVIARNRHSFGGPNFVGSYSNQVGEKSICKACFLDSTGLTTMCHETCHMFGPADMYANVGVNPSGIQTACIMDDGFGDLPSATKFVLGWLDNVKFIDSNNIGSYSLRSYTDYPDALVVYPKGDSTNRNWFFVEYVTKEGNNRDAKNGVRVWKTQMNVDSDYDIAGAEEFCSGAPSSPYEYLEAIHPDDVWNYYLNVGDSVTPYTYPSTSFSDTFYYVGGAKYLSDLDFSGISIMFSNVDNEKADIDIDISNTIDESVNNVAELKVFSPHSTSGFLDSTTSIQFAAISSGVELKVLATPTLTSLDGKEYPVDYKLSSGKREVYLYVTPEVLKSVKGTACKLSNLNIITYYGDTVEINNSEDSISFSDFPLPLNHGGEAYSTEFQIASGYDVIKPYKLTDSRIMSIYYDKTSNKLYWGELNLCTNTASNFELELPKDIILSSDITNENLLTWQNGECYFVYIGNYICCYQNKELIAYLNNSNNLLFCGSDNNSFFVDAANHKYYELVVNGGQLSFELLERLSDYYLNLNYWGTDFNIYCLNKGQYVLCQSSQILFIDIEKNLSQTYNYTDDNKHGLTKSTVRYLDGKYYVFASSVDLLMYTYNESFELVNEECLLKDLSTSTWGPFELNVYLDNNQWIIYFDSVSNSNAIPYPSTFLVTFSLEGDIINYYRYGDALGRYSCKIVPLSRGKFVGIKPYSYFYIHANEESPTASHDIVFHEAKKATCTEIGWEAYETCKNCDYTTYKEIPASGHEKVQHGAQSPTCTEIGWEAYETCKNCNYTTYKEIPATGHDTKTELVKATTTKDGAVTKRCKNCGRDIAKTIIPKVASIKLSALNYTYNGGAIIPSVKVIDSNGKVLVKGTDYTVSYQNNVNIGTATATVTGKGNYEFTKKISFSIKAKDLPATSKVSVKLYGYNAVQVSWNKVSGASGYYVYYKKSTSTRWSGPKYTTGTSFKVANLTDGAKYSFRIYPCIKDKSGKIYRDSSYRTSSYIYTLKKISMPIVKKYSSSKVIISWTNISGESGYQISKSTSKTGTSIVSTYNTTSGKSKVITATRGKTYYYKVRAYRTVDGKRIYGPWSSVISYKLK